MRYLLSLLALSVETVLVVGKPIRDSPLKGRAVQNGDSVMDTVASCGNTFNLFTTLAPGATQRPMPTDFDYLSFCYAFNQPTKTSTAFSYSTTTITATGLVSTVTAVTVLTSTAPGSGPATATATCPIPAPSMICGQGGWGYAANNIYSASGIDAITCHEKCLANPACLSFQVETDGSTTSPTCNLYKVDPSGNNTIVSTAAPFSFFARDCPDHSPAACGNAPAQYSSPVVTTVPPTSSTPKTTTPIQIITPPDMDSVPVTLTRTPGAAFVKRAAASIPLPWFLQPFGPVTMSQICSCIYTSSIPGTTVVAVIPKVTSVYVSVAGRTVTALITTIVTVGGGGGGQTVTSIS